MQVSSPYVLRISSMFIGDSLWEIDTMSEQQLFQERVVKVERPKHHFVLLIATDGAMLGLEDGGDLALFDEADDRVIWDRTADGVRHMASGVKLTAEIDDTTCVLPVGKEEMTFTVGHGPEKLPSEYLEHLQREGWVCLTCILSPEVVEGLERVAGTDRYEHLEMNNEIPKVCQSVAVGRAITEPVSIWLARQYMQTRDLHLGHPPGFRVLDPDDGKSKLGGWHSDFPYTASTGGDEIAYRKGPVKPCSAMFACPTSPGFAVRQHSNWDRIWQIRHRRLSGTIRKRGVCPIAVLKRMW